jgi:hypothetical protein
MGQTFKSVQRDNDVQVGQLPSQRHQKRSEKEIPKASEREREQAERRNCAVIHFA